MGRPNRSSLRRKSWMRRDFAQYKIDFKRIVETSWNNQIILLPPEDPKDGLSDADYMALVANPRMPAARRMLALDTLRRQSGQCERSHSGRPPEARRRSDGQPQGSCRCRARKSFAPVRWLITNEDIHRKKTSDYRWPNLPMSQVAAAHEIGHWLGRPTPLGNLDRYVGHIDGDKYAKTDPNYDQLQYGGTAGHYASLMGGGSLATEYDAAPWLNRVRRHTGALFGWQFVHRSRFVGLVPVSARQQRLTARADPPIAIADSTIASPLRDVAGRLFGTVAWPKRAKRCRRRHGYLRQSCDKVITECMDSADVRRALFPGALLAHLQTLLH